MKRKIIGFLTIFFIFIIGNTYSAGIGSQAGLLGSGIKGGGIPETLGATVLMPHIMAPLLQTNLAESISVPGMGILPQINALMDPVFSPLISEGINNTLLSFNNHPMTVPGLTPIMGFGSAPIMDIGPLTLMGLAQGPVLGIDPLNTMGFGLAPIMDIGPLTLMGLVQGPVWGINPFNTMGFGPAPMMGIAPLPMMGFGPGTLMGIGPLPMMGLSPGPVMGIGPRPIMNTPYNIFSPLDLSIPFNNLNPILNNLSKPHNIPINTSVNNPKTNPGTEQPDRSGNKRVIFLGSSVEGIRPDGTSYIVKHYLDTYTNKLICGYSQGLALTTPDYNWWYGCAPTSTGMIMGYYDIYGYNGITYDLILGGVAELSSYYPNSPFPIDRPLDPPSPTGPTLLCNKAIASAGHLADFWLSYGSTGDPLASGRIIPAQFDCLADFMGTSQDNLTSTGDSNPDGQTFFYFWTDGARMTNTDLFNLGYDVYNHSGTYGIIEYTKYCGHGGFAFNQYILGFQGNTLGFSFSDYINEIDAGRPVMIHLTGHMMLGIGYYLTTETVIVHDTWNNSTLVGPLTMTWGGTYTDPDGITYSHYAVTCFTPI
ncbi:MAG: C39 family peptidase [bacterium]